MRDSLQVAQQEVDNDLDAAKNAALQAMRVSCITYNSVDCSKSPLSLGLLGHEESSNTNLRPEAVKCHMAPVTGSLIA